ncbi:unnamed protein product [Parajaminaea phylloscopi]
MPPGTKLLPFLRGLLLSRGAPRPGHHNPVASRYGRLTGHIPHQHPIFHKTTHARGRGLDAHGAAHSSSLSQPFLALLSHLDFAPLLRGARLALTGHGGAARKQQGFQQSLHSANRDALRTVRSWARPSPRPQGASFRTPFHGPGLQVARNFSAGTPHFAYLITNAPLALRAVGDELRSNNKSGDKTTIAGPRKPRRSPRRLGAGTESQRQKLLLRVASGQNASTSAQASKAIRASTAAKAPSQAERYESNYDLYFPEVPVQHESAASACNALTEMVIPMEPDIYHILAYETMLDGQQTASGRMLDGRLRQATEQTLDAYHLHKLRLRGVFRLLEDLEAGMPRPGEHRVVRYSDVEFLPDTLHHVGYKVRIRGYTATEIRQMLVERLGIEHGQWFGQMVRNVSPAQPSSPASAMTGDHEDDGLVGIFPQDYDTVDEVHTIASPPLSSRRSTASSYDDLELLSSGSDDSMLFSPPPLSFSATFTSMMHTDDSWGPSHHDEDDWLQDSRH